MKKQNGITLIALVITIVVLLILAGVSISMVLGENGIFNYAKKAKTDTAYAAKVDAISNSIAAVEMKAIVESAPDLDSWYTGSGDGNTAFNNEIKRAGFAEGSITSYSNDDGLRKYQGTIKEGTTTYYWRSNNGKIDIQTEAF